MQRTMNRIHAKEWQIVMSRFLAAKGSQERAELEEHLCKCPQSKIVERLASIQGNLAAGFNGWPQRIRKFYTVLCEPAVEDAVACLLGPDLGRLVMGYFNFSLVPLVRRFLLSHPARGILPSSKPTVRMAEWYVGTTVKLAWLTGGPALVAELLRAEYGRTVHSWALQMHTTACLFMDSCPTKNFHECCSLAMYRRVVPSREPEPDGVQQRPLPVSRVRLGHPEYKVRETLQLYQSILDLYGLKQCTRNLHVYMSRKFLQLPSFAKYWAQYARMTRVLAINDKASPGGVLWSIFLLDHVLGVPSRDQSEAAKLLATTAVVQHQVTPSHPAIASAHVHTPLEERAGHIFSLQDTVLGAIAWDRKQSLLRHTCGRLVVQPAHAWLAQQESLDKRQRTVLAFLWELTDCVDAGLLWRTLVPMLPQLCLTTALLDLLQLLMPVVTPQAVMAIISARLPCSMRHQFTASVLSFVRQHLGDELLRLLVLQLEPLIEAAAQDRRARDAGVLAVLRVFREAPKAFSKDYMRALLRRFLCYPVAVGAADPVAHMLPKLMTSIPFQLGREEILFITEGLGARVCTPELVDQLLRALSNGHTRRCLGVAGVLQVLAQTLPYTFLEDLPAVAAVLEMRQTAELRGLPDIFHRCHAIIVQRMHEQLTDLGRYNDQPVWLCAALRILLLCTSPVCGGVVDAAAAGTVLEAIARGIVWQKHSVAMRSLSEYARMRTLNKMDRVYVSPACRHLSDLVRLLPDAERALEHSCQVAAIPLPEAPSVPYGSKRGTKEQRALLDEVAQAYALVAFLREVSTAADTKEHKEPPHPRRRPENASSCVKRRRAENAQGVSLVVAGPAPADAAPTRGTRTRKRKSGPGSFALQ